jgi:hypothetical protein
MIRLVAAIASRLADLLRLVIFLFAVITDKALSCITDELLLVSVFHFAGGHGGGLAIR